MLLCQKLNFRQQKQLPRLFKLCVLLMLQNVNKDPCVHLSQLNVQWMPSRSARLELKKQLKNTGQGNFWWMWPEPAWKKTGLVTQVFM